MNVVAMPVSTWNILIRMRDLIIKLLECSASHAFDRRHQRPHQERRLLVGLAAAMGSGSSPKGTTVEGVFGGVACSAGCAAFTAASAFS